MKIEIEVSEADIQYAIERKVRSVVADQSNDWDAAEYIKAQVKAKWKNSADAMILEILKDHEIMRARIMAELEKKIKAQLSAAMKAVGA